MTFVFAPAILDKAHRLVRRRRSLQLAADRRWEIHASDVRRAPAAFFLDSDLDKVTACQEHTDRAFEWARIRGGSTRHGATTAYRLRGAVLHRGFVYAKGVKVSLESRREAYDWHVRALRISEAALACTLFGNRFFGHFLTDDLPLTLAASAFADPVRTTQVDTRHQMEYRTLSEVQPTTLESAVFDSLIVLDDVGQNDGKRRRYERLRTAVRSGIEIRPSAGVYLVRGTTGVARRLVNEDAVAASLVRRGFRIVRPEELSVTEIVSALGGAAVVVAVEGSQLSHAVMTMHDGATMVALQPPYRFNNVYKDYTDCLGMGYGFVVGDELPGGFSIDCDHLNRLLDRL